MAPNSNRVPMSAETLYIDDDDRYSRLRLIAWWDQQRLARSTVMVVGAGALGNEVLKNLALVGVGTIYIVDFDHVEQSNLARSILYRPEDCGRPKATIAAESLKRLNPDTQVYPLCVDVMAGIGLGLFRDVDVVIGCLDNREARLWVNRCCWKTGTPWIDGGIQEINGVVKVYVPPHACYECGMTENDYRLINLRYSCPLLRREEMLSGKVPTAPTIASIIGGLQAQEALKLIHGREVSAGEALVFNGVANQFYRTRLPYRADCLSHEAYDDIVELPLGNQIPAADLFSSASPHFSGGEARLLLDRDLVVSLHCEPCRLTHPVIRPAFHIGDNDGRCPQCQRPALPDLEHEVSQGSSLANERLIDLGVPAYDIVRIAMGEETRVFLLGGDREQVSQS